MSKNNKKILPEFRQIIDIDLVAPFIFSAQCFPTETLMLLKKIQGLEEFEETRLVGGTALALQIGHRKLI